MPGEIILSKRRIGKSAELIEEILNGRIAAFDAHSQTNPASSSRLRSFFRQRLRMNAIEPRESPRLAAMAS